MAVLIFMVGILFVAVTGIWIYVKWKRTRFLPPGPSGVKLLLRHYVCGRSFAEELSAMTAEYGELVSFLTWVRPVIVLNNAYAIQQAFCERGFTFTGRECPTLMPGLKYRRTQRSIHELEGDEWRLLHSMLSRALLRGQENMDHIVNVWARPRTNVLLDLRSFCLEFCTRVFRSYFFDEFLSDEDLDSADISLMFSVKHSLVWHYIHGNTMLSNSMRTYRQKVNSLDAAVWNALQRFRENGFGMGEDEDDASSCLLQTLLQEELGDEAIIANLSTLMTFAVGSCALQLHWCLLFFLQKEGTGGLDGPEAWLAFVKEVLRLRPILPLGYPRRVLHSTQLFGFNIPRDALLLANIQSAHLDPDMWEDPLSFKPQRFLTEGQQDAPERMLTFGAGRRSCLGGDLASRMLPRAMEAIVTNYEITPKSHVTLIPQHCGLLQQPQNARVVFTKRHPAPTQS